MVIVSNPADFRNGSMIDHSETRSQLQTTSVRTWRMPKTKRLFQLCDKIQALKTGSLQKSFKPNTRTSQITIQSFCSTTKSGSPNRPEAMKNLIDEELRVHGLASFSYQICHIEELELLLTIRLCAQK